MVSSEKSAGRIATPANVETAGTQGVASRGTSSVARGRTGPAVRRALRAIPQPEQRREPFFAPGRLELDRQPAAVAEGLRLAARASDELEQLLSAIGVAANARHPRSHVLIRSLAARAQALNSVVSAVIDGEPLDDGELEEYAGRVYGDSSHWPRRLRRISDAAVDGEAGGGDE